VTGDIGATIVNIFSYGEIWSHTILAMTSSLNLISNHNPPPPSSKNGTSPL
jgi:hypothetical protein